MENFGKKLLITPIQFIFIVLIFSIGFLCGTFKHKEEYNIWNSFEEIIENENPHKVEIRVFNEKKHPNFCRIYTWG